MNTIAILIALGVFSGLTIFSLAMYLKMKEKYLKTLLVIKKLQDNVADLSKKLVYAAEDLRPKKSGYYIETVNLVSAEDKDKGLKGDPYGCIIYVEELDKYKNGESKIKLINVEIITGFNSDQYEHVKKVIRNRFPSLRKTTDITWLESEDNIKEMRKQKLKNIQKNTDL
jgi:hypothetical protein